MSKIDLRPLTEALSALKAQFARMDGKVNMDGEECLEMDDFLTFEVKLQANGFEKGWYFRMAASLYDEPVGPFPTKAAAEEAAQQIPGMYSN